MTPATNRNEYSNVAHKILSNRSAFSTKGLEVSEESWVLDSGRHLDRMAAAGSLQDLILAAGFI